jgi:hypothetical protein
MVRPLYSLFLLIGSAANLALRGTKMDFNQDFYDQPRRSFVLVGEESVRA